MDKKYKEFFTPEELEKIKAAINKGKRSVLTNKRNYLTSDELNKFASVDVHNDSALAECKALFLEQVFSSSHDKDMVPSFAIDAYRHFIGMLLLRAGIACNLKLITPILADLGFRTSAKVIGEFRFVDSELTNAV